MPPIGSRPHNFPSHSFLTEYRHHQPRDLLGKMLRVASAALAVAYIGAHHVSAYPGGSYGGYWGSYPGYSGSPYASTSVRKGTGTCPTGKPTSGGSSVVSNELQSHCNFDRLLCCSALLLPVSSKTCKRMFSTIHVVQLVSITASSASRDDN